MDVLPDTTSPDHAEMQDDLAARDRPRHPRAFEPLREHNFPGGFGDTTAKGYMLAAVGPIALSIRPINFPFPEFQAARRVKHLTLAVAGYPLVTLTGMSADAGFPHQQHS